MTAVVEIHVDRANDVVSVPVQAIVQVGKKTWCYANEGNRIVERNVQLGRSNDTFVELVSGVEAGQRIVLNPTAIFHKQRLDENAISPDENMSNAPMVPREVLARQKARQKHRPDDIELKSSNQQSSRRTPNDEQRDNRQPNRSPSKVLAGWRS